MSGCFTIILIRSFCYTRFCTCTANLIYVADGKYLFVYWQLYTLIVLTDSLSNFKRTPMWVVYELRITFWHLCVIFVCIWTFNWDRFRRASVLGLLFVLELMWRTASSKTRITPMLFLTVHIIDPSFYEWINV